MFRKIAFRIAVLVLLSLLINGCLTTENKLYSFKINPDGSGSGTVIFENIVSEEDEGKDVSFDDFGELIDDYVNGTVFETDNPGYNIKRKEIYEENGKLYGKFVFTFDNLEDAGFYRYEDCSCAPVMYYMGSLSETLLDTNGNYLGYDRDFPIIVWPANATEFSFKTNVKEDMSDAHSLLPLYKTWKENQ
ncbi:MAG: hypothetical protein K9N09_10585 [Candidatus Cloacimonetes bacterium]|nr:hypothetical protein [Candidatus Cloacimonadota bacterium]MCF7814720.1 hypothetical protein [Candidatus Cloacimonadota bacterium]MCF7869139.1 hypothetical protein [Candidatus Cloacimonadota bacterium]MCF7884592.1 hypothetical protein [Candidatus Cloacimonadota bacterium]